MNCHLRVFDFSTLASCVSAIVAIVALIYSGHQTRLSNKQELFDRRMSIWLTCLGLLDLCANNENEFKRDDAPQLDLALLFTWLTNISSLYEIGPVAMRPLEEEYRISFLRKLEEIRRLALEARFVFDGESSWAISDFLTKYQEILLAIYQYQVLMNKVEEHSRRAGCSLDESCQKVGEPTRRKKLNDAFDSLVNSYVILNNANMRKRIEKQVRLIQ